MIRSRCAAVAGKHRHVAHLLVPAYADEVDRSEEPSRRGDRSREGRERPGWFLRCTRSVALKDADG